MGRACLRMCLRGICRERSEGKGVWEGFEWDLAGKEREMGLAVLL